MEANLIISMRMELASLSQQERWIDCINTIQSILSIDYLDEETTLIYHRKLLIYRELAQQH